MSGPRKVRVVFVLNDFIIGGVQRLYIELFSRLDTKRYEMHLVSCMDLTGRADLYGSIPPHVAVHRFAFRSLFDIASLMALARLLAKLQPDVVLASLFFSTTVARVASLFARYPVIAIEQNMNTWKNAAQVLVDRLLAFRSPIVIAASRSVAAFSARQSGIRAEKYTVIHNGIDVAGLAKRAAVADVERVQEEFGFTNAHRIAVDVARLTSQKNHAMLIDAFALFVRDCPEYRLLLIGEGPQREALEARVAERGLKGIVAFAGARQDVVPFYATASFFVSTSFIEGFGIAHAEALACGLPVLTTRTAGPDEMIVDGQNGYFTETDVESIHAGLVRMAREGTASSRQEIAASVNRFDSAAIVDAYDRLIMQQVGRGIGKPRIALMTYAIDNRPAKGTAIVARKCVEELLKQREKYDLTFVHYDRSVDPIYTHGVREVLMPRLPLFLNRRSLRQIWYFLTTTDRFDIIQWFQPRLYPFFWNAPTKHIVVEVHGAGDVAPEAPFDIGRLMFNWTVKTFIRRIDTAIVASTFAKQDIVKHYGFAPGKVQVIYNGVDAKFRPVSKEETARVRALHGLPERFFLGVGRLNPNKNVFRCLRAFAKYIEATNDTDLCYVNVGANGTERAAIDAWLSRSAVRDRVSFISFVEEDDLPAVYGAADVLVFPLLNEGFGLPLLEAMACGTPVLASKTSAPDMTDADAVLVEATDEADIARGMQLLTDPQLRTRLASRGVERVKEFTWERMGERLVETFDQLLQKD